MTGRATGDHGAVVVLVIALGAVLALAGMTASALAAGAVTRQRAAAVADLAALAAAQHALEGPAQACAWATRIALADGGIVRRCTLSGDVAEVVAEVRPPGPLGRLGSATSVARAGPGGGRG
ncbi:MAG: Rv3654c family TadE-like protein, partial [Mycobacteriales bacterium]